jgi:hypothetical protein
MWDRVPFVPSDTNFLSHRPRSSREKSSVVPRIPVLLKLPNRHETELGPCHRWIKAASREGCDGNRLDVDVVYTEHKTVVPAGLGIYLRPL